MTGYVLRLRHLFFVLLPALSIIACAPELTDAEHIARAKEFQHKGDLRSAAIELKSALKKNPRNPEARTLLGEAYLKLGNGVSAEKELRRAIDLGVRKEALLLPLVKSLALQNKHQAVIDEIGNPEAFPGGRQAELYVYLGDAWLGLGEVEKARSSFQKALKIDPASPLAKLGLARLALKDGKTTEAETLVEQALTADPQQGRIWRFKAELDKSQGRFEQAEEAYGKAIQFNAVNIPDLVQRALLRIEMNKLDEAARDVQVLRQKAPRYYLGHFAAGLLAMRQERLDEAQSELETALKLNERDPRLRYFLGLVYLLKNQFILAENELSRFLNAVPDSVKGRQALAWTQYRLKHYDAAKQTLAPVIKAMPEELFSRLLMSRIEYARGNRQASIRHLQAMLELHPDSPGLYAQLGRGLGAMGKLEEGESALKKALELDPELLPAKVQLAMLYMREKRYGEARQVISEIQRQMPDSGLGLSLLGFLHAKQGEVDKAEKAFQKALSMDPANPSIAHNLAQFAAERKDYRRVRELYQQVLKHHPDNLNAAMHLVTLNAMEGRNDEAISQLEEIVQKHPNALAPALSLARVYIKQNEFDRAQTLLEKMLPMYPESKPLLMVLLDAQMGAGHLNRARDTAMRLVGLDPNSPMPYFLLAKVYRKSHDLVHAEKSLQRALKHNPKFLPAQLALIHVALEKGDLKMAQAALAKSKKLDPDNPEVLSAEARLALRQNKPQNAIALYRQALKRLPSSSLVVALSKAYWRAGQKEQAEKTLSDWLKRHPKDVNVAYMRSVLYRTSGREGQAIEQLKRILQQNPAQIDALNDLAWMLRKKDPDKALKYAEKAMEIAPRAGMIADTLAMVLLERGERGRAMAVMKPVAEKYNLPSVQYHWARILAANHRKQDAAEVLEKLLKTPASFPERDEAQRLLEKVSH